MFPAAAGRLALTAGRGVVKTFTGKTIFGTVGRLGAGFVGTGLVLESARVRGFLRKKVSPAGLIGAGRELGRFVEDPSKLLPKGEITTRTVGERVKDIATRAGLIGGVAAATVGAGALLVPAVRGVIARRRARAGLPGVPGLPGLPGISGLPGIPALSTIEQPLGAVQPAPKEEKEVAPMPSIPSIKIINKPQNLINIRFSKKKSFINQQVLIK